MEYKTVILSVFIMSLVLAQNEVEAKACCPSRRARNVYTVCRFTGLAEVCCQQSGCKCVSERSTCPPGYPDDILEISGDAINEYCNLGCVSFVCGALTSLQNSDASETVNEAVEKFTKACSTLCTKGSTTVVKTA